MENKTLDLKRFSGFVLMKAHNSQNLYYDRIQVRPSKLRKKYINVLILLNESELVH